MQKRRTPALLTSLGLFLAIGAILTVAILDRPLTPRQVISFKASTGDPLMGTYFPGNKPVGVILLEGFGSDQVTMTSLACEFARSGWHVFTFDFSGHGRSPGTLTFDNAQTDRLARQALSALNEFEVRSGLRPEQIFLAGHSLGARVALQAATMNPQQVAGLLLMGTQVNLSTNVQSEFFTGIRDAELPWVQALGPQNPPVPLLLISGTWDDILTPQNARLLFARLGGAGAEPARHLVILPALVHNYEPFSARVIHEMAKWINERVARSPQLFGENPATLPFVNESPPVSASARIACWILGWLGILLTLISGKEWLLSMEGQTRTRTYREFADLPRFLWGKLLLWLIALPVAAILGSLFFVIPLGKPVFNLIYGSFIGGYGILSIILYWRGKMPGVPGRLPFMVEKSPVSGQRLLAALGIGVGVLIITAAYARTGWFYVFPMNLRLAWLVIFTPFTALGFWIGQNEAQTLALQSRARIALMLIGLFPFFLYTLLMAALGSLSGMIGGLQGLLVLWLTLAFGDLIQATGRRPWLTAVSMAVLLYWLILPQGVLF